MTSALLSRRAFALAATATTATLLTGCGGGGDGEGGGDAGADKAAGDGAGSANPEGAADAPAPVRLTIPAIAVDTPVIRLGLDPDGTVEEPPVTEHDRAGWYEHSPVPGRLGPSVILGHVTVGEFGDGVFRELGRLRRGDGIRARLGDGTEAEFTVTSLRTVRKADFPTDEVYGDVDRPELRLITCGGPRTGDDEYRDNVIVFAELSGDT
ncbi:class F sortase [Streptomyces sp. NPDC004610]|uniref:class F sortase n=1 Tax=unclassified Streptomyces TaxID=2593676 RepID=UPI0033B62B8D